LLSPVTQAAHARKRPVLQVRSSNPYDKQITTFDADGHIMQLQYAQKAVNKGSSALFLHHNNHIVAVLQSTTTSSGTSSVTSGTSSNNVKHRENKSLFRINHGILAKMTGL
jgi:20S proteasome alpha/beta subunit